MILISLIIIFIIVDLVTLINGLQQNYNDKVKIYKLEKQMVSTSVGGVIIYEKESNLLKIMPNVIAENSTLKCSTLITSSLTIHYLNENKAELIVKNQSLNGTNLLRFSDILLPFEIPHISTAGMITPSHILLPKNQIREGVLALTSIIDRYFELSTINMVICTNDPILTGDIAIFTSKNTVETSAIQLPREQRSNYHLKVSENGRMEYLRLIKQPQTAKQDQAAGYCAPQPIWDLSNKENNDILTFSSSICFQPPRLLDHLKDEQIVTLRGESLGSSFSFLENSAQLLYPRALFVDSSRSVVSSRWSPECNKKVTKVNEMVSLNKDGFNNTNIIFNEVFYELGDRVGLVKEREFGPVSSIRELKCIYGLNLPKIDDKRTMSTVFDYDFHENILRVKALHLGKQREQKKPQISHAAAPKFVQSLKYKSYATTEIKLTNDYWILVTNMHPIFFKDTIGLVIANCYATWIDDGFPPISIIYKLGVTRKLDNKFDEIKQISFPSINIATATLSMYYKFDKMTNYAVSLFVRSENTYLYNQVTINNGENMRSSIKLYATNS